MASEYSLLSAAIKRHKPICSFECNVKLGQVQPNEGRMADKFVMPNPDAIPKTVEEIVDRLGRLKFEIDKRVKRFRRFKEALLKRAKKRRITGDEYNALLKQYEREFLDEKKVRKHLSPKIMRRCYSSTEVTSVTIKPNKRGKRK